MNQVTAVARCRDAEVIDVLSAISAVSGRLARMFEAIAEQRQSEEGG